MNDYLCEPCFNYWQFSEHMENANVTSDYKKINPTAKVEFLLSIEFQRIL